ncbi:MAG: hypothetical protein ABJN42_13480 [Roseibium sp.]|uniref:hypothetical protein n=1 Tax=Roseibium sp. TaxID=1936156 RepID=UPI0032984C9E
MADIKCSVCDETYTEMEGFEGTEQAYKCSADIIGETVVGNYGSTVLDMHMAVFTPSRPESMGDGIICDSCISSMMDEGTLVISLAENRDGVDMDDEAAMLLLMGEDERAYEETEGRSN